MNPNIRQSRMPSVHPPKGRLPSGPLPFFAPRREAAPGVAPLRSALAAHSVRRLPEVGVTACSARPLRSAKPGGGCSPRFRCAPLSYPIVIQSGTHMQDVRTSDMNVCVRILPKGVPFGFPAPQGFRAASATWVPFGAFACGVAGRRRLRGRAAALAGCGPSPPGAQTCSPTTARACVPGVRFQHPMHLLPGGRPREEAQAKKRRTLERETERIDPNLLVF